MSTDQRSYAAWPAGLYGLRGPLHRPRAGPGRSVTSPVRPGKCPGTSGGRILWSHTETGDPEEKKEKISMKSKSHNKWKSLLQW